MALCVSKHGVINKRLSNMDCELKDVKKDVVNHSERLYKLEQKYNGGFQRSHKRYIN